MPHGDTYILGQVINRSWDDNNHPIGRRHNNPLLDTRQYEVQFANVSMVEYMANIIAENLFSQCDNKGRQHLLFKEIVDHSSLVAPEDGFITSIYGSWHKKKTTKGVGYLCWVAWWDNLMGSSQGCQAIKSSGDGWLCCFQWSGRAACIKLVGTQYPLEVQPNYQ